jgi:hypothetical protein
MFKRGFGDQSCQNWIIFSLLERSQYGMQCGQFSLSKKKLMDRSYGHKLKIHGKMS